MKEILRRQNGQVLPFFIVAGTVLLAVIANLSLRNISSGFRSTTLDTSSRVTAAAEGGLERFLSYSYDDLQILSGTCPPNVTDPASECIVSFSSYGDNISAEADVAVEAIAGGDRFEFTLEPNQTYEVNMDGPSYDKHNIYICWGTGVSDSDIYYEAYYEDGTLLKGIVCSGSSSCTSGVSGLTDNPMPSNAQCNLSHKYRVVLDTKAGTPLGLRIRSVGASGEVEASVYSPNGSLPPQGHRIISTGKISQSGDIQSQAIATKSVRVSQPYLPAYFDFGIFSSGN